MTAPAEDRPAGAGGLAAALRERAARLLRGRGGDAAWSLLVEGATLVASTLSFLLLGRTLGAGGYGAYVGLFALIGPFAALSHAGVYLAAMEHVARERERPVDVARSFLGLAALNTALWVPVLALASLRWIEGLPPLAAVLFVVVECGLNGVFATNLALEQTLVGFPSASRLRLVVALARIAVLAALAAAGALSLTSLAVAQACVLGAINAFATFRSSRLVGAPAWPGAIHWRHVRSTLLYGAGIGATMAQTDGDKFALNAAHHQADAGRYGAAYRLMQIMLLPAFALANATHVSFLNATETAQAQLRRALRLSLLTAAYAVPAVAALVLAAPLVPLILSQDFAETASILRLLAPVVVLRAIGIYPMNGLMGLGLNGLRTALLAGNALLSLALYALLIPTHSWQGALVGTLVSELTFCATGWIALAWHLRAPGAARPLAAK